MKKTILSLILILILVASILVLTGCDKNKTLKSNLVGSWGYNLSTTEYVYTFNEDKTGSYTGGTTPMMFTYEDNGTEVSILFDGNKTTSIFKYRIEDNKFIITDTFGTDIEYIKK